MCRVIVPLLALGLVLCPPSHAGQDSADGLQAQLDKKLAERHRRTVELAQLHYASGDWQRAAALFEDSRRFGADDREVLSRLYSIYRRHKDDSKLADVLTALLRTQPRSANWLRELGSCQFRMGRRKEAEATWQKIFAVYAGNVAVAARYVGQAYAQHGLDDKAIALYRKALADRPADTDLNLRVAEALDRTDKPLDALAATATLDTKSSSYRRRRAKVRSNAFAKLALPSAVQAAVQKLIDDEKRSAADLAWAIAQALEQATDRKLAAKFYRRVAADEPKTDRGKAAAAKARALSPTPKR